MLRRSNLQSQLTQVTQEEEKAIVSELVRLAEIDLSLSNHLMSHNHDLIKDMQAIVAQTHFRDDVGEIDPNDHLGKAFRSIRQEEAGVIYNVFDQLTRVDKVYFIEMMVRVELQCHYMTSREEGDHVKRNQTRLSDIARYAQKTYWGKVAVGVIAGLIGLTLMALAFPVAQLAAGYALSFAIAGNFFVNAVVWFTAMVPPVSMIIMGGVMLLNARDTIRLASPLKAVGASVAGMFAVTAAASESKSIPAEASDNDNVPLVVRSSASA